MPPFQPTASSLLTACIVYGLLLAVAWALTSGSRRELRTIAKLERNEELGYYEHTTRSKRSNLLRLAWISATTVTMGIVLINAVTFSGAHNYNVQPESLSSTYVASTFGLRSDQTYPLVAGDGDNGARGVIKTGYFSNPVLTLDVPKKGSVVSVDFTYEKNGRTARWLLEIPVSRITYDEREGVTSSITLHLNRFNSDSFGKTVVDGSRPCNAVVKTAFLTCNRVITSSPYVTTDTIRRGLARLVNEQDLVDSATFVVTPEMYDWIKGTQRG